MGPVPCGDAGNQAGCERKLSYGLRGTDGHGAAARSVGVDEIRSRSATAGNFGIQTLSLSYILDADILEQAPSSSLDSARRCDERRACFLKKACGAAGGRARGAERRVRVCDCDKGPLGLYY